MSASPSPVPTPTTPVVASIAPAPVADSLDLGLLPFLVDTVAAVGQLAIGLAALYVTLLVSRHERARARQADAEAKLQNRRDFVAKFTQVMDVGARMRSAPKHERVGMLSRVIVPLNREAVSHDDGRDHLVELWHDYAFALADIDEKHTGALTVEIEWANQAWIRGDDEVALSRPIDKLVARVTDPDWRKKAEAREALRGADPEPEPTED